MRRHDSDHVLTWPMVLWCLGWLLGYPITPLTAEASPGNRREHPRPASAAASEGPSPASTRPSDNRLWDREPPLWTLSREVTISRQVPAADPQPVGTWFDGTAPDLSTRRLKISLWGPPTALTLSVNKTDVWDRRRFQEPVLTLKQIREMTRKGVKPPRHYDSWQAYDFPCAKPVGQIIVRCSDLADAAQPTAVTHCDSGATSVAVQNGNTRATLTYLPMMTRNVIAVACDYTGLQSPVSVRLYRHRDTQVQGKSLSAYGGPEPRPLKGYDYSKDKGNGPMEPPTSGSDGRFFWIRQRLPAEKTFPEGFEYAMVGCIVGPEVTVETVDGKRGLGTLPYPNAAQQKCIDEKGNWRALLPTYEAIRQASGSAATASTPCPSDGRLTFTLLTSIVTSAEAPNPLDEAKRRLAEAAREGFAALLAENTGWYKQLYSEREKGRVFKGDPEFARGCIPEVFRSWVDAHSQYCQPDPTRYEATRCYAYMEQDWSPWHGLPCYNELYYTAMHVQNRSDRLGYYYKLVPMWLPASKKNAREVFGMPGGLIQHGYLPPIKPDEYAHTISSWEFCMEIPAQVLKLLWDRFDYGGDEQFLAGVAYPAMRETAIFYSHYATLGQDGYYHVIPTVSAEHWGWTKNFERNRDSTSALCMFKWLLNATADASEILQRDAELRGRWREVASKMAPYPTHETPDGPIFTDVLGVDPTGVDYNWFAGFTPTLLADEINLDSPPQQREMMLRTARLVKGWAVGQVAPLLGEPKGTGTEQLINSRSGRIYLFPAVPPDATIAFRDMQARGGFEVSAECVRGRTTYVQVRARRAVPCRLMNPWPGHTVVIYHAATQERVPHETDNARGECVTYPAVKGHVYRVRRDAR
ncbi:MAG: hypothetical protein JXQ75_16220 [Phycisphaerae bacterium]|nr:hypothetical protein [Phycisphaerae bacterium]